MIQSRVSSCQKNGALAAKENFVVMISKINILEDDGAECIYSGATK